MFVLVFTTYEQSLIDNTIPLYIVFNQLVFLRMWSTGDIVPQKVMHFRF